MTEQEWLACEDAQPMLELLRDKTSDRKLRLFAVASVRRVCRIRPDDRCGSAIAFAEAYADGRGDRKELKKIRRAAWDAQAPPLGLAAWHAADLWAWQGACATVWEVAFREGVNDERRRELVSLLRDIVGNPFRPVSFAPAWRTSTAVALASQMYDSRDFSAMPILADAFQDAGCTNEEILAHCRGGGPHVRGCWVVDLVLGKR